MFSKNELIKRKDLLVLLVIASFLLLYKIGSYFLVDVDEPRYAQAAKEMIENHNYLIPTFNGVNRYDKPILFYWAEILSFKAFGVNEFAARLPSALAALATVFLCYLLGNIKKIGFISSLILLTSVEFFMMARLSITDMLLNLCIAATLTIFYLVHSKTLSPKGLYASALFMALGVLCKGPVAIAIPGITVCVFLLIQKDLIAFIKANWKTISLCSLLVLIIAAPWYLIAHFETNGEFTKVFFLHHNVERFTGVVSEHHGKFWFYIATMLIGFLPWTLFLPAAASSQFKKSQNNDKALIVFCASWALTVLLFYSVAGTKLINYILPAYLPLAIIVGDWFSSIFNEDGAKKAEKIYLKVVFVIISLVSIYVHYGFKFKLPSFIHISSIKTIATIILISALTCVVLKKNEIIFGVFFLAIFCSFLFTVDSILIPLANFYEAGIYNFVSKLPAEANLYVVNVCRPSIRFYANRPIKKVELENLTEILNKEQNVYFIAKPNKIVRLKNAAANFQIINQDEKYFYASNLKNK